MLTCSYRTIKIPRDRKIRSCAAHPAHSWGDGGER